MEENGVGGGLFPGMGSGMLGLEIPMNQTQNSQNPHQVHQSQMLRYAHHEADHHNHHQHAQQSAKHGNYLFAPKNKQINLSDEDEPGFGADDGAGDNKRKISPWQRMKWTDTMVRLLIMAVYYIGDEAGSEGPDPTGKKKSGGGGFLQKKGKWKSVSRAMMEKGFYVSPQQCEDKFNDLNKRYKRVNDILGKGTACKVVENQGLLEKMELSSKMKEEVKKLLNSKHLFFREMCAYHNSCGYGTVGVAGASGAHNSPPEVATDPSEIQLQQQQPQQQRCFHSSENGVTVAHSGRSDTEGSKMLKAESGGEYEDEDFEDDDSEDDDDEEEEGVVEGTARGPVGHGHEDEDGNDHERAKRPRKGGFFSGASTKLLMQQLSSEVMGVIQDGSKSPWEKNQWMKSKMIQLEEQQVSYQYQSFELEKQRLKWVKYSGKKERDMEKVKLENERKRLENERMLLLVRQKEYEMIDLHQHQHQHQQQNSSNKRSDPSSLTG